MARKPNEPLPIIVMSDTHCGSTVGLVPDDFTLEGDTRPIGTNPIRQWLWECWLHTWGHVVPQWLDGRKCVLIINGDLIEGVHHRTTEVVSSDTQEHYNIARQVFEPAKKHVKRLFVVKGTECHTRGMENNIARELGAVHDGNGQYARDTLYLHHGDCRIHATHHIGATSRAYLESGQFSIHLGNERLTCIKAGHPAPDIVLRAHRHRFGAFTDGSGLAVVTPPWKGIDRHTNKAVPGAVASCGVVMLDWRERPDPFGKLPSVRWRVYDPDPPRVEQVA